MLLAVVRSVGALALCMAVACGGDSGGDGVDSGGADAQAGPDAYVDPTLDLFRPDHILQIEITMAAADFEVLRNQPDQIGMPKVTCGNQPTEKPYDYFPAEITVDGVTVTNVGVRKKGGFGSLSTDRPGLKVKANEYVSGQRIYGLKRLTLNNNYQDDTFISQCLGYDLFRAAGVAASRCSFAHVIVNGEDLGLYSNVETIKQDFLGRHFTDDSGNLYESGGDFVAGATDGFQPKINRENPDCTDLDAVVTAMQSSDSAFPDAIGAVIDTDAFMTYWAMEVITDHWDGYANNRNNHFFYHDPTSDKFHWIPWGIDALFGGRVRTTRPKSVFACGSIPWRMYDVPATRALYIAKLRDLLATVWNPTSIVAEIDRMETLITPVADPTGDRGLADNIQAVRDFVNGRSAELLAELDAGDPVWPYAAGEDSCLINLGTIDASFDTTWDTLDDFNTGTLMTTGTIAGTDVASTSGFAHAGYDNDGKPLIRVFALLPDGTYAVVFVIIQDPLNLTTGSKALDLANVAAFMTFYDPVLDTTYGGGLMLGGTLTLTAAGSTPGAPITGTISSAVFEL